MSRLSFKIPRLSRQQAFAEQGVTLAYPARSWSGVREDDGAVVFAMRGAEIHTAFDGFRCLLWAPVIEGATEWVDRPAKEERLAHCRRALAHGGADGLVASGAAAEIDRGCVYSLRVEKIGAEYWAFWGALATSEAAVFGLMSGPAHAAFEPQRMAA